MTSKLKIYKQEGQYDLIYKNYGKLLYNLVTPKDYKDKDIKNLLDQEQYCLIMNKYFKYPKNVSKLSDKYFEKLDKEGLYFELQEKYPGLNLLRVLKKDFKKESGKRFNLRNGLKYKVIRKSHVITISYVSSLLLLVLSLTYADIKTSKYPLCFVPLVAINHLEHNIEYYNQAKEYDQELAKYASQFNLEEMSDLDVIITVMNYVRSNTYYGNRVDEELRGTYFRLELDDTNDVGVCRHMGDKYTTIMNLIYPDYKAQNMVVNLNTTYMLNTCNIYGKEESGNEVEAELEDYDYNESEIGNHLVTILKPREGNYYLVIDVTNPSIGVLDNGKIHMFNNDSTESMKYVPYGQAYIFADDSFSNINGRFFTSKFTNVNFDELKQIYGLDAQNETIDKIKTLN